MSTAGVTAPEQREPTHWAEQQLTERDGRVYEVGNGKALLIHKHVRHDHELVEAKSHSLPGPAKLVIPWSSAEFLKATPNWMEFLCSVVDGTQVLERQVAVDVNVENWQEVKRHKPRIEQIVQYDPAIVLGDLYVLNGWGATEVEAELAKRRNDVEYKKKVRRERREHLKRKVNDLPSKVVDLTSL